MSYPVYYPIEGDTLPHLFATYAGSTGASATMTGLAVTDIEIYKDGGTTQRSSDAGYTLLDTDGIDFDGLTGIHGFSIDLSDDTDSGFFAVGPWYHVVVSAVTVDSQTVSFIACAFRILDATRGMAGTALPDAAADAAGGLVVSDAGGLDIDAKLANTNEVTVARMGALTDWIDGGRLDLLLDAIKTVTDLLPEGGALTTIGTDTARLTAARAQIIDDWADGGRLDLLLDAIKVVSDAFGSTAAATLALSMAATITGSAQTGTLSTTQATTDLTGYADDQLIGRVILFTSGACDGEATDITDYENTNGRLTFTDLTTAPGNGDTFVIV